MAVEVGFEAGIPRYNEVLNVEDVMSGTRAGRFVPTPMLASFLPRCAKTQPPATSRSNVCSSLI